MNFGQFTHNFGHNAQHLIPRFVKYDKKTKQIDLVDSF